MCGTLQALVDKSVSPRRFLVLLLGGFAVFALVLASLGIYGLISYSVGQRTQEIGIRMAVGASARDVQGMVIAQTLWLAGIGMVLGDRGVMDRLRARRAVCCSASPPRIRRRSPACCWCSRSSPPWPATSRRVARRGSIRWWRCGLRSDPV